jgi:WhiB family redox-sensing transcriptional regulator
MTDWRDQAACAGMNPETFYPSAKGPNKNREAKEICAICPVRQECLEAGVWEPYGVWGGMSVDERIMWRRRQGIRRVYQLKPVPHGTARGYMMERDRGDRACEACRDAYRVYHTEYARRRREDRRRMVS